MAAGTLYVVATPIGNLKDITQRALEVLAAVDLIAAEDTRVTGKLLSHYGISKPQVSYHEHNEVRQAEALAEQLSAGKDIALVSDAGTPTISDPGYRLISLAARQGIEIVPIPGASSLLAALAVSGLPTDRFLFEGFLPRKKGRVSRLKELAQFDGTVIIFESAQRVKRTLQDMNEYFGPRKMALCREITKKYETIMRGTITEVLTDLESATVKGEIVLVVGKEGLR
ncbi:MAG: 16S rRNA (cytidine(1402)-2'-O)-methyltransferase [Candidatus Marinimicrobia bacterium]|nr:16S rRNA (cytidine(1402)-2'-O)-methyltransferase [Candidatus Neomarinimicrobiota bacterium]